MLANGHIVLSTKDDATLGGVSFEDGDLIDYDPVADTAKLVFDGSTLFDDDEKIRSVHVLDNGNLILSTDSDAILGGLSFEDIDLVEYDRTTDTASLFFDGSLTTLDEKIDAVHVLANGHIVLSTEGDATLGGVSFEDGDLIDYDPVTDTAKLVFDGSTLFDEDEKIRSVHIGAGSGALPSVVFKEFTDARLGSGGTALDIAKPGGTVAGDLLIAAVATDGNHVSSLAAPAGWNVVSVTRSQSNNSPTLGVWWKVAGASETANYTFSWSGDEEAYGFVMRFTGHDPVNPINVSSVRSANSASSSPPSPAVITTVAEAMILRIGGFDDDDITVGDPGLTGHTAITMGKSSPGNGTCSAGAGYAAQAVAGDSGTSTFSLTASEEYVTVTIGIAPVP